MRAPTASSASSQDSNSGPCRGTYQSSIARRSSAAAGAGAVNGGYYGPSQWFGLVGPATAVRAPRRARDAATAARLWAEAERLTGVVLPAGASPSSQR